MTMGLETNKMQHRHGSRPTTKPSHSVRPRRHLAILPGIKLEVTLNMIERHVAYLDLLSIVIRLRAQTALARTELVQAFVEFMQRSGIDFSRFATADEMTRYLVAHFRANMRNRMPVLLESSLFHQQEVVSSQEKERAIAT